MITAIKRTFINPVFLFFIILPSMFFDAINIEVIMLPSLNLVSESASDDQVFQASYSQNHSTLPLGFTQTPSQTKNNCKYIFDEDSPFLEVSDLTSITTSVFLSKEKEVCYSIQNESTALYLKNCSLLI